MDSTEILCSLNRFLPEFVRELEDRFGPCGPNSDVLGIVYADGGPQNRPCYSGRIIELSRFAAGWLETATYEFAHECVHLLDPGVRGQAPVPEEGLARLYQVEVSERMFPGWNHNGTINDTRRSYILAAELATLVYNDPLPLRRIREGGTPLRDLTADQLRRAYPGLQNAAELCEKFQTWRTRIS